MSVEQGAPEKTDHKSEIADKIQELIDHALTNPGTWFNMEIPDGVSPASARSSLTYNVAKSVSNWSIKDGRVYFKFGTGEPSEPEITYTDAPVPD